MILFGDFCTLEMLSPDLGKYGKQPIDLLVIALSHSFHSSNLRISMIIDHRFLLQYSFLLLILGLSLS